MKATSKMMKFFLGLGTAACVVIAPMEALASSNSVDCASIDGSTSAVKWYSTGKDLASEGYLNLAASAMDRAVRDMTANASVTAAAFSCLSRIEAKNPILDLPSYGSVVAAIFDRTKPNSADRRSLEAYAFQSLVQTITQPSASGESVSTLAKVFSQPGAYHTTAQALIAIAQKPAGDKSVAPAVRAALAEIGSGAAPAEAKETRAFLTLSLARNLYASGANAAALTEYEKLFKIGQPMQNALIESAWAQLRAKNYVKSIGLGYELTTGKLSDFFAPEALSIRAISFVENCRYSEARTTAAKFKSEYAALEAWLKAQDGSSASLYEAAIARSEGAVGKETVPEKVWSIWSGSDLFVSAQNAIQKSFREQREVKEWIADHVSNASMKAALLAEVAKIPAARARAASRIEAHLAGLDHAMLSRIATEGERLRFVSIEANQGAGRDLVYRNANPGIADVEKDMAKSERKAKSYSGKLAWGKAKKDDPSAELWIDEIGAFEGQPLNRCGAKAKYQEKLRASL